MRMMDELKPLFLYPAKKAVYVPISPDDKRKGSAILLLTPNLETSSRLMKLPYLYNPKLFISFYIDRNVTAYIDNTDISKLNFDEKEEETISEAMIASSFGKIKFRYADNVSFMDKRYIDEVYNNKTVKEILYTCRVLKYIPDEIKIFVYPNLNALREVLPEKIKNSSNYYNTIYSFSRMNEIHLVSEYAYDENRMRGLYSVYIKTELITCLLRMYNHSIPYAIAKAIGYNLAGYYDWAKNEDTSQIDKDEILKLGQYINLMIVHDESNYNLGKYIMTADMNILAKYISSAAVKKLRFTIFESDLSYADRQRLLPGDFGLPEKRKYPMPDEDHVRSAIRFFNYCDPDDEKELAEAIIKRIKRYDMKDIKVSASNRFKKYYHPDGDKSVKEAASIGNDYTNILQICQHLNNDELKRITFYDTYRDSEFVIKRIIKKDAVGTPVGFLDVYQFPSNPDIAQITLAVDNRYRDQGIANSMVKELLASDLDKTHNFSMYYWTIHPGNDASRNLALKNGFTGGTDQDKYGRYIYTKVLKPVAENSIWKEIPDNYKPILSESFAYTDDTFVTENAAIFFNEGLFDKVSDKLKRFIYKERLKNNRDVLNLYDQIKSMNPAIKRMYLKLPMYNGLNLFVDLSYYNNLFISNQTLKPDQAIKVYFNLITKLINNSEIDSMYKTQTVFIPIDQGIWTSDSSIDITDYRRTINPISVICRLIRTNLGDLKRTWSNKNFVFVSNRGYFKIDFSTLELKDLQRIKVNIRKLMSISEPVVDDYEIDNTKDDGNIQVDNIVAKNIDTPNARIAKMVDRLEDASGITINKIAPRTKSMNPIINSNHLRLANDMIKIDRRNVVDDDSCIVITVDPDGPNGYDNMFNRSPINKPSIDTYCMPKN